MNNKRQRNKLFTMLMLVIALLIPQWGWAQRHSYNFNGFCTDEDCTEKYEPATVRNGWYEISNAGQLYWFAEQVDNGNQDLINANVRLISDIFDNDVTFSYDEENDYAPIATDTAGKNVDVSTLRVWNPIGIQTGIQKDKGGGLLTDENYQDKQKWFGGHFDGQGYTISGLYFNDDTIWGGLFAMLRFTCNIENVKIENCYFKGFRVGSIVAYLEGGSVNNCHNNSLLYSKNSIAGGILAQAQSRFIEATSYGEVNVRNCVNEGVVCGRTAGGIIGYGFSTYLGGSFFCLLNLGKVISSVLSGEIMGNTSSYYTCESCFGYDSNKPLVGKNASYITTINSQIPPDRDFHNGKVAYLLSLSDENWGQDLSQSENFPTYGGTKVYKLCGDRYTNDATSEAEHNWEDGICTNCDDKQEAIFNTEKNSYEISNLGQLLWFDDWFWKYGLKGDENANAHLTTDITINRETLDYDGQQSKVLVNGKTDKESLLRTWKTLGETHTIEGNGHTISGFYGEKFGDGSIQNLTINNAVVIGYCVFGGKGSVTNCHFKGVVKTSGGGGGFTYSPESIISNCSFEGRFYGSDGKTVNAGGFVGCNWGTIKDCSFIGECFNLQGETAKIRFAGGNRNKIENCYSSISASNQDSEIEKKVFLVATYNHGTIQNIAYDKDKLTLNDVQSSSASSTIENVLGYTTEQIKSGEVTYWLNDNKSDGTQAWYQKLSEGGDEHPVLKPTGDNTVYYAYQHGTANQFYSNEVNSHKLAYNAEAEDEANGNHDLSYEAGEYAWTDEDKTQAPTVAVTYTCKVCGKTVTPENMTVVHDDEHDNVAATCTEEGHNYYKTSYTFNDKAVFSNAYTQTLPALGHEMSEDVTFNNSKSIYQKGCTRENCDHHDYYATSDASVAAKANDDESAFTVEAFTMDDATAYDNKAKFTVKELTYNRTFKNEGWQAVYVPFGLECGQINQDYEVANINNFHEYEQADGSTKLELEVKRVTNAGSIPALTPCLIRKKQVSDIESETAEPFHFADVTFVPAEDKSIDCASVTRYYQFVGTLQGKSDFDESSDFCIGQGNLWPAVNGKNLSPQRWYLKATDRTGGSIAPTAQLSRIGIRVIGDGEATGIENIHVTTDYGTSESGKQGIYDLQGHKLDKEPTSGIYIKNGKKYVK